MPALSDATRERIGKLLPMLSADNAGEVFATARAIGVALGKAGHDWHDLVKCLTERPTISERAQAARPAARGTGFYAGDRVDNPREREPSFASRTQAEHRARTHVKRGEVWSRELIDVINAIERTLGGSLDDLGERAFTFLEQLRNKGAKAETVKLSGKQDRWIRHIAADNGANVPWSEIEIE